MSRYYTMHSKHASSEPIIDWISSKIMWRWHFKKITTTATHTPIHIHKSTTKPKNEWSGNDSFNDFCISLSNKYEYEQTLNRLTGVVDLFYSACFAVIYRPPLCSPLLRLLQFSSLSLLALVVTPFGMVISFELNRGSRFFWDIKWL